MKKRLLACLLTVAMLVGFIPCPALAANAGDVTYRDYDESSQTWNENATREAGTYTLVSDDNITWGDNDGWYVLNADTTFESRISVEGEVHLILMDGYTLTANSGITVAKGNSLTIYAQSKGTGALVAKSNTEGWAGIGGGESGTGGEVTINGGKVTATGTGGAGIGGSGGNGGAGGKITINGGEVTATSAFGAGIGGGDGGVGGEITINGGTVEATSNSGAGIGGGSSGTGGEISITSGTVKATSRTGAGIGSGSYSDGGTISISGGEITATSSGYGAGIGGGESGAGGEITITGGTVEATGSNGGAGIGGGDHGTGGKITISNGKVTATGKGIGAGIGGGAYSDGGTISISGGEITATSSNGGACIGGGWGGAGGEITIMGGTVKATNSSAGAGIGGGESGAGGKITISNGTVEATSHSGAGIGGGASGAGGTISITSGTVTGTSRFGAGIGIGSYSYSTGGTININGGEIMATSFSGAGIGGGAYSDGGTISINGGEITATSSNYGAGIGGGECSAGGNISITSGEVKATGFNGAGIGSGGDSSAGGEIAIDGGTVEATSNHGAGIGGGINSAGGTINITSGTVTGTSLNAAGIGGGKGGDAGTFTTAPNGNAFILASSIQNTSSLTNGVIFQGNDGKVYGGPITLTTDATIPAGKTLVIEAGQTLIIPDGVTLTNNGTIINNGTITGEGTLSGNKLSQSKPGTDEGYTIHYDAETIQADSGYEVSSNTSGDLVSDPIPGQTLYVRKAESNLYQASDWTKFDVPDRPSAPSSLQGEKTSYAGSKDGKITGLIDGTAYQISDNNGNTWKDAVLTETEITDLTADTYWVRVKATGSSFASEAADVEVLDGPVRTVYTLTVNGGSGGGEYAAGASVTITANVPSGKRFTGWTVNQGNVTLANTSTVSFVMPGETVTITANFEDIPTPPPIIRYRVTVETEGGGTVSGGGTYRRNTTVTVTAAAHEGYRFVEWTENGRTVSSSEQYRFTILSNRNLVAVFEQEDDPTPPEPEHVHAWASAWSTDDTHHWHECLAENCDCTSDSEKDGYAAHVYDDEWDEACNVCGHIRPVTPPEPEHVHQWAEEWSTDDTHHWHECLAEDCEITADSEKDGYAVHDYADEWDETCNVCGHIRPVTPPEPEHIHQWAEEWSADSSHHWHECLAEDCEIVNDSEKDGYAAHTPGEWIVDIPASSYTAGRRHKECTVCGWVTETESIPATGSDSRPNGGGSSGGGSAAEVSPSNPRPGDTVTGRNDKPVKVTARPNGTYAFTQPSGSVTIAVTYKPIPVQPIQPVETPWNSPFTDVSRGEWYYDAVRFVFERGLMNGYDDGRFGPNDPLSRAQFTQILFNKEGRPAAYYPMAFSDVAGDAWYAGAVLWTASQGIVGGYGDGSFGPHDYITREQLAVMLWRYTGSPAATNKELYFNDESECSGYALEALRWAVENGILTGYGDGQLAPQGQATRGEVAQMLYRLWK